MDDLQKLANALDDVYIRLVKKHGLKTVEKALGIKSKKKNKVDHAPLDVTCEKCGRRYCDHENKY